LVARALKNDVVILRKCPWGAMTGIMKHPHVKRETKQEEGEMRGRRGINKKPLYLRFSKRSHLWNQPPP